MIHHHPTAVTGDMNSVGGGMSSTGSVDSHDLSMMAEQQLMHHCNGGDSSNNTNDDSGIVPVVIVPVNSLLGEDQPALSPSSNTSLNASGGTGTTNFCFGYLRKRTILFAAAIPLAILCTIRVYRDYYQMDLPVPHTAMRIIDVNSPPVELKEGETIATLMDAKIQQQQQQQSDQQKQEQWQQQLLLRQESQQQKHSSSSSSFLPGSVGVGGGSSTGSVISNMIADPPAPPSVSRATTVKQQLMEAEDKQQHHHHHHNTIPVVVDRGEVPMGVGVTKQNAADALLCRESVINYVINATNGKDECTGLQKAFDETCSQEEEEELEEEGYYDEDIAVAMEHQQQQNHHHLQEQQQVQDGNEIWLVGQQQEEQQQPPPTLPRATGGVHNRKRRRQRRLTYKTTTTRQRQYQQYQSRKRQRKFHSIADMNNAIRDFLHKVSLDMYWVLDWIGIPRPKFLAENQVYQSFWNHIIQEEDAAANKRRRGIAADNSNNNEMKRPKQRRSHQHHHDHHRSTSTGSKGRRKLEDFPPKDNNFPMNDDEEDNSNNNDKISTNNEEVVVDDTPHDHTDEEEKNDDDDDEVDGNVEDDDDLTNPKNTTSSEEAAATTEPPAVTITTTTQQQHKPHINVLNLPTGHHHVSAKTLEKTLLLQQEDKVLSQVKKAVNNATTAAAANATIATTTTTTTIAAEMNIAKEDAAASAKAVADTNELVSAVLNDPTSIEARACCASILNVYHENCNVDAEEEISDKRLFIVVLIMAFCGMVKSLIRHFKIRWLPEAAGCILVGVASGFAASYFPHQDFSFDGNWFLRILVPPIVFEAALSIDKKSFNRHLVPIIIYSTIGTVLASFLTASMVHNGTHWLGRFCETIPYIESLIFGALISSIDPIAVLSVLSNMGMTDTDTLYVLVFGESLLNDGVAIVLFHTLVEFLDANVVIDSEAITNAVIHFFVVALGSVLVGIGSGILCTLYYWAFHGCQTPLVEVLMFLCWALLPYYVCDGIGWSGIVSSVTVGFVMDMYVIGLVHHRDDDSDHSHDGIGSSADHHHHFEDERHKSDRVGLGSRPIFSSEGHLSPEARIHIHFVTEIVATMMETAIFAYLGLFLFSHRYHWNLFHVFISIMACCISRAIMIPMLSAFANWITSMQKYKNRCRGIHMKNSPATGVIVDKKMQMVLWFAGLRGAMSFALVEHIPLFDAVTGEGTRVKAELKAMTSASIMFTVFVLGGSTSYFMDHVGLAPKKSLIGGSINTNKEMTPLMMSNGGGRKKGLTCSSHGTRIAVALPTGSDHDQGIPMDSPKMKARQRLRQKDDPER